MRDRAAAVADYREAARRTTNLPERGHLITRSNRLADQNGTVRR